MCTFYPIDFASFDFAFLDLFGSSLALRENRDARVPCTCQLASGGKQFAASQALVVHIAVLNRPACEQQVRDILANASLRSDVVNCFSRMLLHCN